MLIEFSVGNYRSFHEQVTFSMIAADISSKPEELDINNRFHVASDLHLLTSAVMYGANASGKSNFVKALEKNYIEGRYGAIPFPGDLEQVIRTNIHHSGNV